MNDTRTRLRDAALLLFEEQGFERTTAIQIANRAGTTERTFFRYFADKREVLFAGGPVIHDALLEAIENAPESSSPLAAMRFAVLSLQAMHEVEVPYLMVRRRILAATPALHERELAKLDGLASAASEALQDRGVAEHTASICAQIGMAVLARAVQAWLSAPETGLGVHLNAAFDTVKAIVSDAGDA